jgi:hypothetical protein
VVQEEAEVEVGDGINSTDNKAATMKGWQPLLILGNNNNIVPA